MENNSSMASSLLGPFQAYLHPKAKVLKTHACGLIALEKPTGVLSHPNGLEAEKRALFSLPYSLKDECYLLGKEDKLHVLHRLDGPTSGVMLLSTHTALARLIKELFRARKINKHYHCLVKGCPPLHPKLWVDRLSRKEGPAFIRMQAGLGTEAKTRWSVVHKGKELSCLLLEPMTGLSHQLRVQCALRHCPIVGDQSYGDFKFNRRLASLLGTNNLCLHASSIALNLEYQGKILTFEASSPLPAYFEQAKQCKL